MFSKDQSSFHHSNAWILPNNYLHLSNGIRRHYLSNAVLQAKNASNSDGLVGSARGTFDNGLLDLLEGKLAVLRFQMKIKEELEAIASRLESSQVRSESAQNESSSESNLNVDTNFANTVREKAREISLDLKSITQLYNEYALPFELWEVVSYPHFLYLIISSTFTLLKRNKWTIYVWSLLYISYVRRYVLHHVRLKTYCPINTFFYK